MTVRITIHFQCVKQSKKCQNKLFDHVCLPKVSIKPNYLVLSKWKKRFIGKHSTNSVFSFEFPNQIILIDPLI